MKRRVVHSCPHCGVRFETKRRIMYNTRKAYWNRVERIDAAGA